MPCHPERAQRVEGPAFCVLCEKGGKPRVPIGPARHHHASSVTNRCVALYRETNCPAAASEGPRSADRSRWFPSWSTILAAQPRRSSLSMVRVSRSTITSAEGSFQSEVIAFQSTGSSLSSLAIRNTAGRRAPKGGRNNRTGTPAICSSVWLVRASSSLTRPAEASARLAWLQEWFPIRCPSATIRRTNSGSAWAWLPTIKNVARTSWLARASSRRGVNAGLGPSSKVSASSPGRRGAISAFPKIRDPGQYAA